MKNKTRRIRGDGNQVVKLLRVDSEQSQRWEPQGNVKNEPSGWGRSLSSSRGLEKEQSTRREVMGEPGEQWCRSSWRIEIPGRVVTF